MAMDPKAALAKLQRDKGRLASAKIPAPAMAELKGKLNLVLTKQQARLECLDKISKELARLQSQQKQLENAANKFALLLKQYSEIGAKVHDEINALIGLVDKLRSGSKSADPFFSELYKDVLNTRFVDDLSRYHDFLDVLFRP